MHLYLDGAELVELEPWLDHPVVWGVTTNPTLLRRAGVRRDDLPGFVQEVLARGARAVQVQVMHADLPGMLDDARQVSAWADRGRVVVKIPATPTGVRAAAELGGDGVPCTLTAVYAPEQALWAQQVGAAYAAPYLGRLDDAGEDGLATVADMQAMLDAHADPHAARPCRLLVASVRSREAAVGLLRIGVGALTVRPALAAQLLDHAATADAERAFLADADAL